MYVHGTGDRGYRPPSTLEETPLHTTLPAFTMQEMLDRNTIPANLPAATTVAVGSTNRTEVVTQLYQGAESFAQVTVINGGHNWPMPDTHQDRWSRSDGRGNHLPQDLLPARPSTRSSGGRSDAAV
jgi:hypothetical protein